MGQYLLTAVQQDADSLELLRERFHGNESDHELIKKSLRAATLIDAVTTLNLQPLRRERNTSSSSSSSSSPSSSSSSSSIYQRASRNRTVAYGNDRGGGNAHLADLRFHAWQPDLSCGSPLPTRVTASVLGVRATVTSTFIRALPGGGGGGGSRYLFKLDVTISNDGPSAVQFLTLERRIAG